MQDMTPRFNIGLGCVTYGTKDAERKGRKLGLECIGDAKLDQIFKKKDDRPEIRKIIIEGLHKLRAKNIREGKI